MPAKTAPAMRQPWKLNWQENRSPEVGAEHAQCDPQRATAGPRNTTHDQPPSIFPHGQRRSVWPGQLLWGFSCCAREIHRYPADHGRTNILLALGRGACDCSFADPVDLRSNRWGFQWILFWSRVLFRLNLFFLSLSPLTTPYQ